MNLARTSLLFLLLGILASEAGAKQTAPLDAKLTAQWELFEKATALGLKRMGGFEHPVPITRSEWESLLQTKPPFSSEDLRALRERQDGLVQEAKERDARDSTLDLDKLRGEPPAKIREFCAQLPKGGMLHVHSWGTLSEDAAGKILAKVNPFVRPGILYENLKGGTAKGILYPSELAFLQKLKNGYGERFHYLDLKMPDRARLRGLIYLPAGSHPFKRFEAAFTVIGHLFSPNLATSEPLMFDDLFARAQAEKVSYLEVAHFIDSKTLAGLDEWARKAHERYGITVRMQQVFDRFNPPDVMLKLAAEFLNTPMPTALAGINLLREETNTPMLEHGQALYFPVLKAVLDGTSSARRTAHAGEMGDPRNVRDAILMGAERIGHGVKLRLDPVTLEYARLHKLPMEENLTSNVRLQVVPSIEQHPFLYFQRLGLRVSLSTDDEGILRTDINNECLEAITRTDISYQELRQMILNSLETAFAPKDTLTPLEGKLQKELAEFETGQKALYGKAAIANQRK